MRAGGQEARARPGKEDRSERRAEAGAAEAFLTEAPGCGRWVAGRADLLSGIFAITSVSVGLQIVYKAWLCSQYFEVAQLNCRKTIPCKQYCLEVQTRCPFILPDNDEVIYGGLSSFICTGLYETFLTNDEPECCDVRREAKSNNPSKGMVDRSGSCPRAPLTASSATRLCSSHRLRLCVLVLILLHTVLTASAAHNATALTFGGINTLDESSASED
ncbi:hypothetical protein CB1_060782030 [Camelus ferus]|nr:hypothetical protein CB1_060782030 [Camelus ferus]